MHICDLTTLYIDAGAGGVNTYLTEKARYLAASRKTYRHTIVVPGVADTTQSLFHSTLVTIRSPCFFYNPHHRVLINARHIKRLLAHIRPDIIEVDCVYFLAHWARAAMGGHRVPLFGFYHSHLPSFYARPLTQGLGNTISHRVEALAWRYMAYCMRPLDAILVASNDIYDRLATRVSTTLEYLPLGVNSQLFQPSTRTTPPHAHDRPVILYVGRLSQEKDLHVLFDAFRLLNQQGKYRLCIVGDGPLRARTEQFAQSTPHVDYAGAAPYGEKLAALYAAADILALPSRNETFGLAILEALASGLPVVAMAQGGPSNILCAPIGALATPGDPVDFADKLAFVLANRPQATQCRNYVTQHFSWDVTFTKLLQLYEEMHKTVSRKITSTQAPPT
jgi:alpha-1,6-mannosyltransferase